MTESGPAGDGPLLLALARLQNLLLDVPAERAFLTTTAGLVATVAGPRVACVFALPRGGGTALGASSARAARLHHLELLHGEGPGREALRSEAVIYVEELAKETRWHACRIALLQQDVASVLSVPLQVEDRTVAVLKLYSAGARRLGRRDVRDVLLLGQAAATALVVREQLEEQAALNRQLREAVASRPLIDQALGIVMALRGCTASEAFDALRQDSQQANQPVREIAAGLVSAATGRPPEPTRPFVRRQAGQT